MVNILRRLLGRGDQSSQVKIIINDPSNFDEHFSLSDINKAEVLDEVRRKAKLPFWYTMNPLGQPRTDDIVTLRNIAQMGVFQRCINLVLDEVLDSPHSMVAMDPLDDGPEVQNLIKVAEDFLDNASINEGSYFDELRPALTDYFEGGEGVLVKQFLDSAYDETNNGQKVILDETPPGSLRGIQAFDFHQFQIWITHNKVNLGHWQFNFVGTPPRFFTPRETIIFKDQPVTYTNYGRSRTKQVRHMLETFASNILQTKNFYTKGGIMQGIMHTTGVNTEDRKKIENFFIKKFKDMKHKLALFQTGKDTDFKWIPLQLSVADLAWLDGLDFIQRFICSIFGVMPFEIGLVGDASKASASEQSRVFRRRTVRRMKKMIENKTNREVIWLEIDQTKRIKFKYDFEPDPEVQRVEQETIASQLDREQITVNDWRVEQGKETVPWGEEPKSVREAKATLENTIMMGENMLKASENQMSKNEDGEKPETSSEEDLEGSEMDSDAARKMVAKLLAPEINKLSQQIEKINLKSIHSRNAKADHEDDDKRSFHNLDNNDEKRIDLDADECFTEKLQIINEEERNKPQESRLSLNARVEKAKGICESGKKQPTAKTRDFMELRMNKTRFPLMKDVKTFLKENEFKFIHIEENEKTFDVQMNDFDFDRKTSSEIEIEKDVIGIVANVDKSEVKSASETKAVDDVVDPIGDDILQKRLDDLLDPLERQMFRTLADLFGEWQDRILNIQLEGVTVGTVKEAVEGILNEQELADVITELMFDAFKKGTNLDDELKVSDIEIFSLPDRRAREYFSSFPLILAERVTDKVENDIKFELVEGISNGESINTIRDRINQRFTFLKKFEADRIARTEINNAATWGRINQLRSLGRTTWRFFATLDDRLSACCAPFHNQIFDIDDVEHKPPLHPNCRCTVLSTVGFTEQKAIASWFPTKKMGEIEFRKDKSVKKVLQELYVDQNLGMREVSDELGVSHQSINKWLDKFGIQKTVN